jgi:twitching motility protein PilT
VGEGRAFRFVAAAARWSIASACIGLTPQLLQRIAGLHHGLILVTGPTGSGKTTTIAALVEVINQSRQVKVITIEDPIESSRPSR